MRMVKARVEKILLLFLLILKIYEAKYFDIEAFDSLDSLAMIDIEWMKFSKEVQVSHFLHSIWPNMWIRA